MLKDVGRAGADDAARSVEEHSPNVAVGPLEVTDVLGVAGPVQAARELVAT